MSLRCAIYARYSSDQQSPLSITDQIRKCREYANQQGWSVLEGQIYTDAEISGAGSDRPGLQRLLAQIQDRPRPFDVVLIDDTSRLSRRQADQSNIVEQLRFCGLRLVAVSQGIDSAHEQSDVLMTVHGLVDQLYIAELAKKTHRGLEGQVLRGFHAGGRCFGYRNEPGPNGVRLVIDEHEASIVRLIFEMCAEGRSLKTIAKTLNAEHIPSPRPRAGKQYATWCPTAIHAMLRRERYVGRVVWNRNRFVKRPGTNKRTSRPRPRGEWRILEVPELRIISADLWQRVQDRLAETKRIYGRGGGGSGLLNRAAISPYLLTGFIKCGRCGANLIIVTGRGRRGRPHYGCGQNFLRGACPNNLKERQDTLEGALFRELEARVMKSDAVEYALVEFERQLREQDERFRADLEKRRGRIHELEGQIAKLVAGLAETGHSKFIVAAIAERERELSEIHAPLAGTGEGSIEAEMRDYREFVEKRIGNLRELLGVDVQRARTELAKNVKSIRLVPSGDGADAHYVAEGEWDLLGGGGKHTRLVAGGGFEPPTFGL